MPVTSIKLGRYIVLQKAAVRAGAQLNTPALGFLLAGQEIKVVAQRTSDTGRLRLKFTQKVAPHEGWCSYATAQADEPIVKKVVPPPPIKLPTVQPTNSDGASPRLDPSRRSLSPETCERERQRGAWKSTFVTKEYGESPEKSAQEGAAADAAAAGPDVQAMESSRDESPRSRRRREERGKKEGSDRGRGAKPKLPMRTPSGRMLVLDLKEIKEDEETEDMSTTTSGGAMTPRSALEEELSLQVRARACSSSPICCGGCCYPHLNLNMRTHTHGAGSYRRRT